MVPSLASERQSFRESDRCTRRTECGYSADLRGGKPCRALEYGKDGVGKNCRDRSTDRRGSTTGQSTGLKCHQRRGYASPENPYPPSPTHQVLDSNAREPSRASSDRKKSRNEGGTASFKERPRTRRNRSSRHRHSSRHKKRGRSWSVSRSSSSDTGSSSTPSFKRRSASTTSKASASLSSSGSSTSSSRRDRRKSRRQKDREERKQRHKEKKSGSKSKRKKEKKKKEKTSRKSQPQWGQYGVLQECDMWNKRQEFQLWLMEIKNRSLEELLPWEERSLFRDYMEDYNTATLPHEKFYNLEKWEREQREGTKQAQATALSACSALGSNFFNDEKRRRDEIRAYRELKRHHEIHSTYQDMRDDVEKINAMRHQQRLQTEMSTLFRMGRVTEAQKIRERLRPDEKF